MSYSVSSGALPFLAQACEAYPDTVPNRWKKVAEFVQTCILKEKEILHLPHIKIGSSRFNAALVNEFTAIEVKSLAQAIGENRLQIYARVRTTDSPIVFLPTEKECCGKTLKILRDRPCKAVVIDVDTVHNALHYHSTCGECNTKYYTSYAERVNEHIYQPFIHGSTLMISKCTGFTSRILQDIIIDVECGNSFEEIAYKVNRKLQSKDHELSSKVFKTRIEEGYFLHQLLTYFNEGVIVSRDSSCRLDIDAVCALACDQIFRSPNKWLQHKCSVAGCASGFIMCDGNAKIHRRICAADKSTIKLARYMPNTISCCPNSPQFGGQHAKASKYCMDHEEPKTTLAKKQKIQLVICLKDQTCYAKHEGSISDLPSNDDNALYIACKQQKNVKKFHDTTAGVMFIVRPCGIIIDWREMYTCESASQLFVQLLKLYDGETDANIKYIGYDRACEFHPFLKNLAAKGNEGAKILLNAEFLVDRFHVRGHTTPSCDITHKDCQYHPSLSKFQELEGVNTECAEQCFSWLNKFQSMVKYMTASRAKFLLHTVINGRNGYLESKLSLV